jgi:DNA-binding transcriptional LysR family regulator
MTNIRTDILRGLVAVVDCRSFTKAAATLGITQPAVSAQIKRLQAQLGCELFDRSSQELALTPQGELVVNHARRLLSLNDQIIHIAGSGNPQPELAIRVGTPSDFVAARLPNTLAHFRERCPDVRFIVRIANADVLTRELRAGELDILVTLSRTRPHDARHSSAQDVVWVRGLTTELDLNMPVPLVSYGDSCIYRRIAVQALTKARLGWEDVFTGPSMMSLSRAVGAGLGVMPLIRRRATDYAMLVWDDGPLPKLPDLYGGIFIREGGASRAYEQLADEIAEALYPDPSAPAMSEGAQQTSAA